MTSTDNQWWYELDGADRVTAVCDGWDRFALANEGQATVAATVVGRSLWDFVAGVETVHLLRRLLRGVRVDGRAVEVPFRCDGPAVERHMQFRAEALDGGRMRITTQLVREVPLDPPLSPAAQAEAKGDLILMCSWCNRLRVGNGWVELAEGVARLGLFSGTVMSGITHGMCAGCVAALEPLLEDVSAPRVKAAGTTTAASPG